MSTAQLVMTTTRAKVKHRRIPPFVWAAVDQGGTGVRGDSREVRLSATFEFHAHNNVHFICLLHKFINRSSLSFLVSLIINNFNLYDHIPMKNFCILNKLGMVPLLIL